MITEERELAALLPTRLKSPRDMAVHCCTQMSLCFAPPKWPSRPDMLATWSRESIQETRDLMRSGGRPDGDYDKQTWGAIAQWDRDRAAVHADMESRVRGALWALVTLRNAVAATPGDDQAARLAESLQQYIADHYGIDDCPWSYARRNALAQKLAGFHARRTG